jgi:hypothetical protein
MAWVKTLHSLSGQQKGKGTPQRPLLPMQGPVSGATVGQRTWLAAASAVMFSTRRTVAAGVRM